MDKKARARDASEASEVSHRLATERASLDPTYVCPEAMNEAKATPLTAFSTSASSKTIIGA